ncbi:3-oxoacyl-ACP synthase III family protein [Pseudomonas sessilinigenes]|uniref:Ketoacyl-ACP synthase III n=1 Tax=Pseudomonas sessilinigenes TaxID=658629 RepID=A0ABX8MHY4_9PSED|nr:ketoacyl-ACP synthase III [Pseudomonas sessilinigenes]AZC27862.1 3-oxoacyl-ACP synthase, KASIII [Pseudomonas sessilinigenes]QXH38262.1 ketoacyl-ACP synthase III [Pseudomonas sessilinigenes]
MSELEFKDVRVIRNVRVEGIACSVPQNVSEVSDLATKFGEETIQKIMTSTGVVRRHVVDQECSSDLCVAAAERLIADLDIDRTSIDTLIFVSQTHDHTLPATACILQDRLQLSTKVAAFDVALGCSGYVYGLWLASSLISGGGSRRVLLLVGDTISKIVSEDDRSVAALFGDAGSATLLKYDEDAQPISFVLGTDGKGASNLIVPAGGFRDRTGKTSEVNEPEVRGPFDLYMNGAEIFAFTLARVAPLVKALHESRADNGAAVDHYVFHQANKFMLEHLVKRMKLPREKVLLDVENVGNTSCTSIPLAVSLAELQKDNRVTGLMMLAGFGVGYSWAGCIIDFDKVWVSPMTITGNSKERV